MNRNIPLILANAWAITGVVTDSLQASAVGALWLVCWVIALIAERKV